MGAVGLDNIYLLESNNLSDLTNAETARTSLGLGSSAIINTGQEAGRVPLIGIPSTSGRSAVVIDTGSVTNGRYRLWSDTFLEQYRRISFSSTGAQFTANYKFPRAFTNQGSINLQITGSKNGFYAGGVGYGNLSTTGFQLRAQGHDTGHRIDGISFYAVGL